MKSFLLKLKIFILPCAKNNYRPTVLENRFLVCYLLVLIFLKIFFVSFLVCFPKTNFFADISKSFLFELTNNDRERLGLDSLKQNDLLSKAAYLKAEDMLENGYFSHESPSGVTPWYWIEEVGYDYKTAGENLGIGFLDSEEIYQAWYDSVLHQKNLLNAKYNEIGIAVLRGNFQGNETTVVVQLFGSQKKEISSQESSIVEESTKEDDKDEKIVKLDTEEELIEQEVAGQEMAKKEPEKEVLSEESSKEELPFENYKDDLENKTKGSLIGFSKFMAKDYNDFIQKLIFYSLCLITFLLMVNAIVKFDIQHRDLVFKAAGFSIILIAFGLLNKEFIIQNLPHALLLNIF
jgi:hypothetical protein